VGLDSWNNQEVGADSANPGAVDNSDLFGGTVS